MTRKIRHSGGITTGGLEKEKTDVARTQGLISSRLDVDETQVYFQNPKQHNKALPPWLR